jgi:hypothetical protein
MYFHEISKKIKKIEEIQEKIDNKNKIIDKLFNCEQPKATFGYYDDFNNLKEVSVDIDRDLIRESLKNDIQKLKDELRPLIIELQEYGIKFSLFAKTRQFKFDELGISIDGHDIKKFDGEVSYEY